MGHVPMLANKQFAEFSKKLGQMALGASEEAIQILSKVYFFTVEFGLTSKRVIGAGILVSCEELAHIGNGKFRKWDLEEFLK